MGFLWVFFFRCCWSADISWSVPLCTSIDAPLFLKQDSRTSCCDEKNIHLPSVDGAYTALPWAHQVSHHGYIGYMCKFYEYVYSPLLRVNNNNNNRIQRRNSRFFAVSSVRCEPSPIRTPKWPERNHMQITLNTSSVYHVQHVTLRATLYEGTAQLLSLTKCKSHLF